MEYSIKKSQIKEDSSGLFCECPKCEKIHRVGLSKLIKLFVCSSCKESVVVE